MDLKIDPKMLASQALVKKPDFSGKKDDPAKLKAACQQFEALFVHSMYKEMRKTVPTDGLVPAGSGQDVFQEMMDWEVAQKATQGSGLGIAEALYRQLQVTDE